MKRHLLGVAVPAVKVHALVPLALAALGGVPWILPGSHREDDHAKGKCIGEECIVQHPRVCLRRLVRGLADIGATSTHALWTAHAEVNELNLQVTRVVPCQKNVLEAEVAVRDAILVQKLHGGQNLCHQRHHLNLPLSAQRRRALAPLEELALSRQGRHHIGHVLVPENTQELADRRERAAVQLLQDPEIPPRPLGAVREALLVSPWSVLNPRIGHPLYCDKSPGVSTLLASHQLHTAAVSRGCLQVPQVPKVSSLPVHHSARQRLGGLLQTMACERRGHGHRIGSGGAVR
mmetsp:Transcript_27012/g.85499  ORF Transcript_27012/g.85499 Transcript_27012/m.85499 type:complete len:291 (-) Transcript_27012:50-922(-)